MYSSRHAGRMCRRPDCQGAATATLSFRYDTAEAILLNLVEEPHPSRWDLCTFHADTLRVPRGWVHLDERASAANVAGNAGDRPVRSNRYAALSARLPEISLARPSGSPVPQRGDPRTPAGEVPPSPLVQGWDDEVIPGQLIMPLHDVGLRGEGAFHGPLDGGYPGNVVPLMRRGGMLDSGT